MSKIPNFFVFLHPIRDEYTGNREILCPVAASVGTGETVGEKVLKRTIFLEGLLGSSAPMLFASLASKCQAQLLFVLQDAEEAGYFYHDLTQLMGTDQVLFFPSSYRRAVKYAQRDAASEILRTEVLTRLTSVRYVVTYPEALAELVVSKKNLDSRTLIS